MKKIDDAVLKETKYIALWTLIFSVLMQAVFLIIGKWDYTVLLGNLLSAVTCILNFFLMGLSIQKALTMDEKDAKNHMKTSSTVRRLGVVVITVIGVVLPVCNIWAVIIPLIFPSIAIRTRLIWDKIGAKKNKKEDTDDAT